jgi:pimeloyl-ACP methyl ester carboxylesterase
MPLPATSCPVQVGWGFTDATPFTQQPDLIISPQQKREHLYSFWQQHIGRPMALVGGSLGGAMALDFALAYPEAVEKLVLIDAQVRQDVQWSGFTVLGGAMALVGGSLGGAMALSFALAYPEVLGQLVLVLGTDELPWNGSHYVVPAAELTELAEGKGFMVFAASQWRPLKSLAISLACCLQGFIDGIGPMASLPRSLAAAGVWVLRTEQLRMVRVLAGVVAVVWRFARLRQVAKVVRVLGSLQHFWPVR